MALASQVFSHCRHSQHMAQERHRSASAMASSFVNGNTTSVKLFFLSSGERRFCATRFLTTAPLVSGSGATAGLPPLPSLRSFLERKRSIDMAAAWPCPTACTMEAGPLTTSPPANTPAADVCSVTGSALMVPFLLDSTMPLRKSRSEAWPMAGTMLSAGISNSEPGIGSGRLRPLLSGSPRRILLHTRATAFLPSALTLTGAAR